MEAQERAFEHPDNYINEATFRIWSDIVKTFGSSEKQQISSGSEVRDARKYALQFAILFGGLDRFNSFSGSEKNRPINRESAKRWEEAAKLATEGNWGNLQEEIQKYAQILIDENRAADVADDPVPIAFTNLANSI